LRMEGLGRASAAKAVLGVRPEDVQVVSPKDQGTSLTAPIYSFELTGENTLVNVRAGNQLLSARADKEFAGDFDQLVGIRISPKRVFLFDASSRGRIVF
jgi:multiple sugar transport system ATP-binding protein